MEEEPEDIAPKDTKFLLKGGTHVRGLLHRMASVTNNNALYMAKDYLLCF